MKTYCTYAKEDKISKNIESYIKKALNDSIEYSDENPELVISIGGDGTMLQSVHRYIEEDCYFVGIHTGTLGFFTNYLASEVDDLIQDIKKNQYIILERHLLDVSIVHNNQVTKLQALNEFRIDYGFTTQVIEVYINDELLEVFRGNGLCVSTPSGSTAYNKALGGAVIYPGYQLMQLTEVAAIHHNAYRSLGSSIILDHRQKIKFKSKDFKKANLATDHKSFEFSDVDYITVEISKNNIKFIEYKETSFVKRLRRSYISE